MTATLVAERLHTFYGKSDILHGVSLEASGAIIPYIRAVTWAAFFLRLARRQPDSSRKKRAAPFSSPQVAQLHRRGRRCSESKAISCRANCDGRHRYKADIG
jgi:hypothetical protein